MSANSLTETLFATNGDKSLDTRHTTRSEARWQDARTRSSNAAGIAAASASGSEQLRAVPETREGLLSGARKCPTCRSTNVRPSRFRRGEGLLRRLVCMPKRCRRCGRRFLAVKRSWIVGSILCVPLAVMLANNMAGSWRELSRSLLSRTIGAQTPGIDVQVLPANADAVIWSAQLEADANEGVAQAQFELGLAHLNGTGARPDTALARQWITRAAEQDLVAAQAKLGTMYHDGRGALQSFSLAREWLERAARKGNAEAQFRLGVMHRQGQGMQEDHVGAYVWFNLAAAQGHDEAREARDDLLALLAPDEILAAQQSSQQFPAES
jgi:hypothetical protein